MQTKKVGVITLALTLVSLGLLLLANNFTGINLNKAFSILWPSIIIAFGLELIITKIVLEKGNKKRLVKIDGASLTVLIIIVVATSVISTVNVFVSNIDLFNDFGIGYKYDSRFNKEYTLEVKDKKTLILDTSYGDVEIIRGEKNKANVDVEILMKHNDEEYASKIADSIVEIDESNQDVIDIKSNLYQYINNNDIRSITINYLIEVPEDFKVEVNDKHGDVTIENIESVKIFNEHGEVIVKNILKDVEIKNTYDDVSVYDVEGKVRVINKHGEVKIERVNDSLQIENLHGSVKVADIIGDVYIKNTHNDVNVSNVQGNVEIDSDYSEVIGDNIKGNVDVKTSHEEVELKNIEGNVIVNNSYDDVKLRSAYKNIDLKTRHGNIYYEAGNIIEGKVNIENEYGDIYIKVLEVQKGRFIVNSKYGDISNDIGLNVKDELNEQSVDEVVESSKSSFYLKTRNGDILIENN
ncbi:DUF4097 family beta strand repeat-containing protein [Caldisalinibacter kiritimatiensis]|uniref:Adhesin domain-containing protein n=1 Tax=Caldisalinibacter kiritimatiensis TaxID=1304284 RepID=R1CQJ3_9FIRM|nr:hypothetical protein [Caldisalinibacter kiritimatiensis]EOD00936.1 hypothetical protein L21TH_1044 [Caldisalinibacter kiritimatiensis]